MRKIIVCSILLITLVVNAVYGQMHYSINGRIINLDNIEPHLKDGDTISLEYTNYGLVKKTLVKDNSFFLEGNINEPTIAMLRYRYGGVKILLDSSTYQVKIEMQRVKANQYSYKSDVVTKSGYHMLWDHFYDEYGKMMRTKRGLLNRRDSTHNVEQLERINIGIKLTDSTIIRNFKTLAIEHPDNDAVPYILPDAPDFSYLNYINIYNTLTDRVKNSIQGKKMLDKLNAIKNLQGNSNKVLEDNGGIFVGKKLPLFQAVDSKGNENNINAEFAKSKYTLIDFWASWCSPCRTQNIALRGKKEALKKSGLTIIGFSLDNDSDNWKQAVKTDNTGWLQLSDLKAQRSPLVKYLNIYNIPTNILVDVNGIVVAKDLYGDQLELFLKQR